MKENQHIEYKESWRDEYLKWICGFANADGGMLVIGRNDKGVVGVANAARLMEDIPNAFFRAGMIEAWGRGIERIMEACRTANTPEPTLRYEPSGLWVEFSFPAIRMDSATPVGGGSGGVATQKTTQKILTILARHPSFSRREIAEELGDISENGVKYHLEKLKASGHIRRLGADKGGHWEVLK